MSESMAACTRRRISVLTLCLQATFLWSKSLLNTHAEENGQRCFSLLFHLRYK